MSEEGLPISKLDSVPQEWTRDQFIQFLINGFFPVSNKEKTKTYKVVINDLLTSNMCKVIYDTTTFDEITEMLSKKVPILCVFDKQVAATVYSSNGSDNSLKAGDTLVFVKSSDNAYEFMGWKTCTFTGDTGYACSIGLFVARCTKVNGQTQWSLSIRLRFSHSGISLGADALDFSMTPTRGNAIALNINDGLDSRKNMMLLPITATSLGEADSVYHLIGWNDKYNRVNCRTLLVLTATRMDNSGTYCPRQTPWLDIVQSRNNPQDAAGENFSEMFDTYMHFCRYSASGKTPGNESRIEKVRLNFDYSNIYSIYTGNLNNYTKDQLVTSQNKIWKKVLDGTAYLEVYVQNSKAYAKFRSIKNGVENYINVAEGYDSSFIYHTNYLCVYPNNSSGKVYQCLFDNITGDFNANHWKELSVNTFIPIYRKWISGQGPEAESSSNNIVVWERKTIGELISESSGGGSTQQIDVIEMSQSTVASTLFNRIRDDVTAGIVPLLDVHIGASNAYFYYIGLRSYDNTFLFATPMDEHGEFMTYNVNSSSYTRGNSLSGRVVQTISNPSVVNGKVTIEVYHPRCLIMVDTLPVDDYMFEIALPPLQEGEYYDVVVQAVTQVNDDNAHAITLSSLIAEPLNIRQVSADDFGIFTTLADSGLATQIKIMGHCYTVEHEKGGTT